MLSPEIVKILEAGCQAPSGDNSQPWRFEVENNTISVFNLPGRDNAILNFNQSGSLMAHGALIENIEITARHIGYIPQTTPFPDPNDETCTARIVLTKATPQQQPLFNAIAKRATNRRAYKIDPIPKELLAELESACEPGFELRFTKNREAQREAAASGASMEQVILEDQRLHRLLFKDVMWSAQQERSEQRGLFIATMEFNPIQRLVFKLASSWKRIRILNKLGLARFVASQDAKLYATGYGLGAILMPNEKPVSFLTAGRIFQRIWLVATTHGLGLQPVSALFFMQQRVRANQASVFSDKHLGLIKAAYQNAQIAFAIKEEPVAIMFRLGKAKSPSARSSRKNPDILER